MINKFKKILYNLFDNDKYFFATLFSLILLLFRKAFGVGFFIDDYFFLKISRVQGLSSVLSFFSPFKDYFYRPLPTELFYYLVHQLNYNLLIIHLSIFILFFLGLLIFYKILKKFFHSFLAKLTVTMYALHLVHVFQLYQIATAIEVFLFTFLVFSFYLFTNKRYFLSLFFYLLALLSKETALVFPFFLLLFSFYNKKLKRLKYYILPYFLLAACSFLIYQPGINAVEVLPTYQIKLDPGLLFNNLIWYFLWGLGFFNGMPNCFVSLLQKPLPKFWELFKIPEFSIYFFSLISYLLLLIFAFIRVVKKIIPLIIFCFLGFLIFISPTLPIFHKWMVRLTIPLIFLSIIQAKILFTLFQTRPQFKKSIIFILVLYSLTQYFGTNFQQNDSTYLYESHIFRQASQIFQKNQKNIVKNNYLYFSDDQDSLANVFGQSKKLKISFHDQSFIDYFFPNSGLTAIYNYEQSFIPDNAYIIRARDILD